jgi:hypothetical protein
MSQIHQGMTKALVSPHAISLAGLTQAGFSAETARESAAADSEGHA